MALNVATLGQVFTTPDIVQEMRALVQNSGRVLEPSCGAGAFSDHFPGCVAIEYDPAVCPPYALNLDFFAYPESEKFDTIIGNPPYVALKQVAPDTRARLDMRLFDGRSNLYLFFIEKCIRHLNDGGELIFITPRDFMKATAARRLNEFIFSQGTLTYLKDLGDARIFPGFNPNCVIFRFEKGNYSRQTQDGKRFDCIHGQLLVTNAGYTRPLSSLFQVKVGAVSGADSLFTHPEGNREFVCSKTIDTGETRRMFYNEPAAALLPYKAQLLARKIRSFDESTWWQWGRGYPQTTAPRIYVNAKTRRKAPFFMHPCTHFDGSVLALFPHNPNSDLAALTSALNAVDWEALGFVCDGRYLFSQKALENCLLPDNFGEYA